MLTQPDKDMMAAMEHQTVQLTVLAAAAAALAQMALQQSMLATERPEALAAQALRPQLQERPSPMLAAVAALAIQEPLTPEGRAAQAAVVQGQVH
jgi:hypothetical protein